MSSYEQMDVVELRHEYQDALEGACKLTRQIIEAWESGEFARAGALHMAFKAQDSRVRHLKRLLTVEAV